MSVHVARTETTLLDCDDGQHQPAAVSAMAVECLGWVIITRTRIVRLLRTLDVSVRQSKSHAHG